MYLENSNPPISLALAVPLTPRFAVSKGVRLIKRQPLKGTVACKVTVIRFSGDIIKQLAGDRLNLGTLSAIANLLST